MDRTRDERKAEFEANREQRLASARLRQRDAITRLRLVAETIDIIESERFEEAR